MNMQELIAKLETAPEESWRLDDAIYEWFLTNDHAPAFARFTQSLDAALTLVPKNCRVYELKQCRDGWRAMIITQHAEVYGAGGIQGHLGLSPAIALTIAALKARAS